MRRRIAMLLLTLLIALALPTVAFADPGGGKASEPGNPSNPLGGSFAETQVTVAPSGISIFVCGFEQSPVLT